MNAAIIDNLVTLPRRRRARKRGISANGYGYIQTNAGQLRFVDTGGSKPVLLTSPDGPCVIEHYRKLIEKLSVDFRVICFDMPGFGFSFPSSHYRFGIAESADAIIELLDTLSARQVVVAFTCVNGFVAMNLAKRYPERVSHLVLAQTPSLEGMRRWTNRNIPSALRVPYVGQILGTASARYLTAHWFDMSLPRDSEHKTDFVDQARNAIQSGGCFCLASLVQGTLRSPDEDVHGVSCPTLMIHGDNDFSHKGTDFQSFVGAVPQARIVTFNGCGHFPNLERIAEYVQHLRVFVIDETQRN